MSFQSMSLSRKMIFTRATESIAGVAKFASTLEGSFCVYAHSIGVTIVGASTTFVYV